MNSPSPSIASTAPAVAPLPASLKRSQAEDEDLDSRIRQVEQRLIAREENLRRRFNAFSGRVKEAAQPTRLLAPALGAVLAGSALWWLVRGKTPSRATAAAPASGSAAPASRGELPWVNMIALVWPLLPQRWRSKVSPATASTAVAIGLPLVERLLGGRRMAPLATMPHVELTRYAGTWYEIARLPVPFEADCKGQPSAHYRPRLDGRIDVVNRCPAGDGRVHEVRGQAEPVVGSGGAKLRISLWPEWLRWLPMAWSDYWIVHVDNDYSEALVGSPSRNLCWLLSRRRHLPVERVQVLIEIARDQGFDVERLQFVQRR